MLHEPRWRRFDFSSLFPKKHLVTFRIANIRYKESSLFLCRKIFKYCAKDNNNDNNACKTNMPPVRALVELHGNIDHGQLPELWKKSSGRKKEGQRQDGEEIMVRNGATHTSLMLVKKDRVTQNPRGPRLKDFIRNQLVFYPLWLGMGGGNSPRSPRNGEAEK